MPIYTWTSGDWTSVGHTIVDGGNIWGLTAKKNSELRTSPSLFFRLADQFERLVDRKNYLPSSYGAPLVNFRRDSVDYVEICTNDAKVVEACKETIRQTGSDIKVKLKF
jgi:hypothetical protein